MNIHLGNGFVEKVFTPFMQVRAEHFYRRSKPHWHVHDRKGALFWFITTHQKFCKLKLRNNLFFSLICYLHRGWWGILITCPFASASLKKEDIFSKLSSLVCLANRYWLWAGRSAVTVIYLTFFLQRSF